jgi:hypothetical protein
MYIIYKGFFCIILVSLNKAVLRQSSLSRKTKGKPTWSSGICGGQSGAGVGFLRVLEFPLPVFIPPNSPSSQSPGAGTIG